MTGSRFFSSGSAAPVLVFVLLALTWTAGFASGQQAELRRNASAPSDTNLPVPVIPSPEERAEIFTPEHQTDDHDSQQVPGSTFTRSDVASPLPNNAVVALPLHEYAVLRELRDALFGTPSNAGELLAWKGEQTECVWSDDNGCSCSWEGVFCKFDSSKQSWRVAHIKMDNKKLQGSIPSALSELEGLETLNLAYNRLKGGLPKELSTLENLRAVYLHNNQHLNGPLPPVFSELRQLDDVNLSGNSFSGSLPPSWKQLSAMTALDLSHNQLTGTPPPQWSSLSRLERLVLDNNLLIGTLPTEWTSMVSNSYQKLEVNVYDNMLLGPVPDAYDEVTPWATVNFYPQEGQIRVSKSAVGGFPLENSQSAAIPPKAKLLAWISSLVALLSVSACWMFFHRRMKCSARKRRFARDAESLSAAERRYLDENHHAILLENPVYAYGRRHPGCTDARSMMMHHGDSADSALEMGLMNQDRALEKAASSRSTGLASATSNASDVIATVAPPPRATLEDLLAAVSRASSLPGSITCTLGPVLVGQVRGRQAAIKVVEVPEAGVNVGDPQSLLKVKTAAQRLEASQGFSHPSLSLPFATGVARMGAHGASIYFAHEVAPAGSLLDWLRGSQPASVSGMSLPWPTRLRHAHEVAEALLCLRTRGMVHGALHAGNVLLDGALHSRLAHGGILPLIQDLSNGRLPSSFSIAPISNNQGQPSVSSQYSSMESPFMSMMASSDSQNGGSFPGSHLTSPRSGVASPAQLFAEGGQPLSLPAAPAAAHMDPACFSGGQLSAASDTYSFGILLLQLLTGRASADGLVSEVRSRLEIPTPRSAAQLSSAVQAIVDPSAGPWPPASASAVAGLALACTDPRQRLRPDLKFHVVPKLAALAKEATSWLMPNSSGGALPSPLSSANLSTVQDGTPAVFLCPILREPMSDPVVAADGYTYEREAIQRWMDEAMAARMPMTSPMTNLPLSSTHVTPVHTLRSEIISWKQGSSSSRQ